MATTISSNTSSVTTQGIGSGLDIASIVDKLVTVDSAPLVRLQTQEAAYQTRLSAYSAAKSMLSTFQNSVAALANPAAFGSFTASIGNDTMAGVTIDTTRSGALSAGSHTLRVDNLATSQRTAATGVASSSTALGTGTLTIDIGTWNAGYTAFTPNGTVGSKSITIDASNNTLAGVRDAINRAGAGVTASIVNDGSGNRLVLASTQTGAANGFRISTLDADQTNTDAAGLSQLAFDPAVGTTGTTHVADAGDARFALDGLAIVKPGNTVTDAIEGLTLNLKAADSTATTTLTLSRDTTAAKKNVNSFVTAYNAVVGNLASLTSYNPTTKVAAALNGDASMRLISTRLQAIAASVIPTGGGATMLGDIGVKFTNTGTLTVDDAKLTKALATDPDSVGRLFAKTGVPSDAGVTFADSTDKTQVGSHALTVSALATQGGAAASAAAGLVITAGVNDTFDLTVDHVPTTITLGPGTYANASALAAALQSRINGSAALSDAKSSVVVSADANGALSITSQRYGTASTVAIGGGNGATNLFGSAPTSTTGTDVAGTLDGVAFVGAGQNATGASGTSAQGLKLVVTGGATGSRGTVQFNRGLASQFDDALTQFLDDQGGLLDVATDSINASIKSLQTQEDSWTTRLVAIRARYTAQYNAMDALVASLNSTSSYLTQQLDALAKQTNNRD